MLTKNNSLAFGDVDVKQGIVSGYFASFDDEPDSDGDIIVPGAFLKTIAAHGPKGNRRIKHLVDHDLKMVPAVILELGEDQKGVAYVSKAGTHALGVDFVKMVDSGIITEHSFGYDIIRQNKGNHNWNYLTELKMWEGTSMLSWGANPNTPITGSKSFEDLVDEFDKLIKALTNGTYTDETMLKFQERANILSVYFKQHTDEISRRSELKQAEEKRAKTKLSDVFFQNFKTALHNG